MLSLRALTVFANVGERFSTTVPRPSIRLLIGATAFFTIDLTLLSVSDAAKPFTVLSRKLAGAL